jgi:transcription elongation factor Elf1
MLHARNNGDIVTLFPEARYSLCGTTAVLPKSLGKMVRKMNIPVATLIMHGHHINSPMWSVGNRGVKPVESELKLLFTQEETQTLSVDEINSRIVEAFQYDDFAWQKEKGIRVKKETRAEGLHGILYQCPACNVEYRMTSEKATLSCGSCGKIWDMSELGELKARTGETEFSHIPDWYEWERLNVRKEVQDGTYSARSNVRVESLPNDKKFVVFEEPGHLTHNMEGFRLTGVYKGEPYDIDWQASTLNYDTLYLFPDSNDFSVTKTSLATEELFMHYSR